MPRDGGDRRQVPLRIAHVISTRGMGGAERFLASLVLAGHDRGWKQVVLNPFATEPSAAMGDLSRPVPYRGRSCDRVVELPSLRHWLGDELRQFEPDIVHVMLFQALAVTATLPRRPGSARLLTHVYGERFQHSVPGRLTRQADRLAGARFDRVVAISHAVRQYLVSDYGYPDSNVTCIPLGWQGQPKPPVEGRSRPTVVCVAALRPEKGHEILLSAMASVRRDVPDVRLLLVGQGERRAALEAQVAADALEANVEFVGAAPDIWAYLAEADVFAIASRSEAFGIAIVEAMAAGLPVVAPAVGAIPELVRPGVNGELFAVGDHQALAGHLVQVLTSPRLRSDMSRAARATAEPLTTEKALDRYFDVYDELLALIGKGPASAPPPRSGAPAEGATA